MDEQFNKELKVFLVTIAQKYGCDFRGSIEGCLNTIQLLEHEQELIITVIKNYELKDRLVDQIYEYFIKNSDLEWLYNRIRENEGFNPLNEQK